jgi:hypothetical protein
MPLMDKQRVVKPGTPINRDVNAAQRASLALSLRASKMTYEEIAKDCGYASAGAARKAILRELDRCVVKNADELRAQESDMLDRLHKECWKIAMDENHRNQLYAVDRILSISERRAKLFGLDIPVNNNPSSAQVIVRELPPGYLGGNP